MIEKIDVDRWHKLNLATRGEIALVKLQAGMPAIWSIQEIISDKVDEKRVGYIETIGIGGTPHEAIEHALAKVATR